MYAPSRGINETKEETIPIGRTENGRAKNADCT